ncbi:MAG: hypothetical protein Fur006_50760 [Coleofasciculaceae cyanobacterium]
MYRVDADHDRELDMALQQQSSDNVCDRVNETCFEEVGVPLEASPHKNLTELASEQQFEQFISNLLKYGVFLSSTIVLIGGILGCGMWDTHCNSSGSCDMFSSGFPVAAGLYLRHLHFIGHGCSNLQLCRSIGDRSE